MKGKVLMILCVLFSKQLFSQGGGPPMLTDDPGTPGTNNWEINTSFNTHFAGFAELETPLLDVNYGLGERTQLKIEMPLLITEGEDGNFSVTAGNPVPGVKIRFLDEDKHWLSMSTFPAVAIPVHKEESAEYKLPVQLEKTVNKFRVGLELGYLYTGHHSHHLLNGNLFGYKFSEKFEMVGEFYLDKNFQQRPTAAFVNFGFRYEISSHFIFINSCGTQVLTPANEATEKFFSFTGLQVLF